jgi:glycosyltransferase involved in cell wall biosynthesis
MTPPIVPTDIAGIEDCLARSAWAEARAGTVALLDRHGPQVPLLLLLARAAEGGEGPAAALPAYAQAAAQAPLDAAVQEAFARALERAGRPQDAAMVRFTLFSRGGRDPDMAIGLAAYLFDSGLTISGDRVYDGPLFARLAMIFAPHPLLGALPLISRYWAAGDGRRAIGLARDCAALLPGDAVIWRILGSLVYFHGRVEEARAALDAAVTLSGDAHARIMRALLVEPVMMSEAEIATCRAGIEAGLADLIADPGLRADLVSGRDSIVVNLFQFAYHGADDRPLMEKIARMFDHADPGLRWSAPHLSVPASPGRPRRIGIVGSLEIDSISRMLRFLPPALARRDLEIHYFSETPVLPAVRQDMPGTWHVLPPGVAAARQAIAVHELDVLLFTDLFMNWIYYFLAFSRLARVQCLWGGHPVTSGLASVDYFISSESLERPDADRDYSETLIRLPDLTTVYPSLSLPPPTAKRGDFGIAEEARLYFCTQTLFKLHPAFDAAMRAILERDPRACLVLFENPRPDPGGRLASRLSQAFAGLADRVRMLPRLPLDSFLDLYRLADVVLDTFHFGGGNTTLQAFQAGVPVVTLPGPFLRGRSALGFYRVMEFTDLVARDPEDYVRLAIRVANDRAFRARCVAEIEARRHRLFDRGDAADAFADLLADWARRSTPGTTA